MQVSGGLERRGENPTWSENEDRPVEICAPIFILWAIVWDFGGIGKPQHGGHHGRCFGGYLAVTPVATSSKTPDMRALTEANGFPPMQEARISLYQAPNVANPVIGRLADHIVESFHQDLPLTNAA